MVADAYSTPTGRPLCDACGARFTQLRQHFRQHPACRLQIEGSDDDESDIGDSCTPAQLLPTQRLGGLAANAAADCRREQVATDLSHLRFEHGLDSPAILFVKDSTERWLEHQMRSALQKLKPLLREGVSRQQAAEAIRLDLFEGLDTAKQELAYMKVPSALSLHHQHIHARLSVCPSLPPPPPILPPSHPRCMGSWPKV